MEKNDIDDLLDGFLPPVDANNEEPPVPPEEPPVDEPPAPDTPLPDGELGEPPPEEVTPPSPPQEPSTPEPPAPVVDPRDAEIQQMRDTIATLQQTIETVAKQATAPVASAPTEPVAPTTIKFIETEEDLDKALNNIDNFNTMLMGVVAKAREMILADAQQVSMSSAHQVYTQRTAVNEFYAANQDLADKKSFVGVVANELASAHPEWDMLDVIKNLAPEVRGRLKLGGTQTQVPDSLPTPPEETPAFAGGHHARSGGGSGALTKIEKEVNDLISD